MGWLRKNFSSLVWCVLILAFLLAFSIINFCGFEQFCTADMYSDTLVSKLMWEQKTLFPEGWVFGNQYYVFVTPVLAALIYGLCGSVNLAMELATTVMTLLILVSFWWMLRPVASRREILAGTAVLLGCVIGPDIVADIEGQILYILASYYAGYLIALFVVFGDYIRVLRGAGSTRTALALSLALCFCTGMQSLRQTAVMVCPLLLFEGCRVLRMLFSRERTGRNWAPARRTAAYTAANVLGLAVIRILGPASVSIYGDLSFNRPEQYLSCISTAVRALRSITGLKYLTADTPLLGLAALVFVGVAAAALLWAVIGRMRDGDQSLAVLLLCSIVCVDTIGIVVNISTRSIYLFPWYALAAVSAVALLKRLRGRAKGTVSALLAAALAVNLCCSYLPAAKRALKDPDPYQKEIAAYVVDEGYTRLYGGWLTVTGVSVWTDGAVDTGIWFGDVCAVLPYINTQAIYGEEDNAEGVYLVHQSEEAAFLDRAELLGASLCLEKRFEDTPFALYTSDRQLMFFPEQEN